MKNLVAAGLKTRFLSAYEKLEEEHKKNACRWQDDTADETISLELEWIFKKFPEINEFEFRELCPYVM